MMPRELHGLNSGGISGIWEKGSAAKDRKTDADDVVRETIAAFKHF